MVGGAGDRPTDNSELGVRLLNLIAGGELSTDLESGLNEFRPSSNGRNLA